MSAIIKVAIIFLLCLIGAVAIVWAALAGGVFLASGNIDAVNPLFWSEYIDLKMADYNIEAIRENRPVYSHAKFKSRKKFVDEQLGGAYAKESALHLLKKVRSVLREFTRSQSNTRVKLGVTE